MFDEGIQALGVENVRVFSASWENIPGLRTNFVQFKEARAAGYKPEAAAFETFTGHMAQTHARQNRFGRHDCRQCGIHPVTAYTVRLRELRGRHSASEVAKHLDEMMGGISQPSVLFTEFATAFPDIPFQMLYSACHWQGLNAGGALTDEGLDRLLHQWLHRSKRIDRAR